MLKITYLDGDVRVEHSGLTAEILVAQRSVVALRAGQSLVVQPGYGSLTLPADLPGVEALAHSVGSPSLMEVIPCEANWLEVTLKGTWIAESPTSEAGLLVVELEAALEQHLADLWQLSRDGCWNHPRVLQGMPRD